MSREQSVRACSDLTLKRDDPPVHRILADMYIITWHQRSMSVVILDHYTAPFVQLYSLPLSAVQRNTLKASL
jgi:hypothetical protein